MKIRAIYIPDARYADMPVFEKVDDKFICIDDDEITYDVNDVLSDSSWIIISIDEEEVTRVLK